MAVIGPEKGSPLTSGRPAGHFNRFWRRPDRPRPLVIAHRGDSFHAPENTLEAAQRAWEVGADAWELDVRLTRDRVPVVIHDASLLRTSNVAHQFAGDPRSNASFLVADFDLEEIRTLDAGSWFLEPASGPRSAADFGTLEQLSKGDRAWYVSGEVRVPTLADALELTARLDWQVNIELKTSTADEPRFLDAVLDLVTLTGTAARVAISSFDHTDVVRVVRRNPAIATGVLTATPLYRPHAYVREWVGADAYHPSAQVLGAGSDRYRRAPSAGVLRTEVLDELHSAGVPIYVYTVNDSSEGGLADHLAEVGVAGIFTDDPTSHAARWGGQRKRRV